MFFSTVGVFFDRSKKNRFIYTRIYTHIDTHMCIYTDTYKLSIHNASTKACFVFTKACLAFYNGLLRFHKGLLRRENNVRLGIH